MNVKLTWRDPKKELPNPGDIVAVIEQHNKQHKYQSCEIWFGQVISGNEDNPELLGVMNNDYTGQGSKMVQLRVKEGEEYRHDMATAWLPVSEFILPDWIPHNDHWGDPLK